MPLFFGDEDRAFGGVATVERSARSLYLEAHGLERMPLCRDVHTSGPERDHIAQGISHFLGEHGERLAAHRPDPFPLATMRR